VRLAVRPAGYATNVMTAASTSLELDGGVVARLLTAAVLCGLVGIEREATDQPAGLRTHIAVGLGAALFGVISTLGFQEFDQRRADTVLQADVTRVASNVVVGIGFLGAGVIFRQGNSIRNLTTAASLWAVAAIGLACGVVLLVSLVVLRPIRNAIRTRLPSRGTQLHIELAPRADVGELLATLERVNADMDRVHIERRNGLTVVTTHVRRVEDGVRGLVTAVSAVPGVQTVSKR
jgi:putative Mg2+ transporter-C (MgtC) family protein